MYIETSENCKTEVSEIDRPKRPKYRMKASKRVKNIRMNLPKEITGFVGKGKIRYRDVETNISYCIDKRAKTHTHTPAISNVGIKK